GEEGRPGGAAAWIEREPQRVGRCLRQRPLEEQRERRPLPHPCLPVREQPSGVARMHRVQGAVGGGHDKDRRHSLQLRSCSSCSSCSLCCPCGPPRTGVLVPSPTLSGGFLSLDTARLVTRGPV